MRQPVRLCADSRSEYPWGDQRAQEIKHRRRAGAANTAGTLCRDLPWIVRGMWQTRLRQRGPVLGRRGRLHRPQRPQRLGGTSGDRLRRISPLRGYLWLYQCCNCKREGPERSRVLLLGTLFWPDRHPGCGNCLSWPPESTGRNRIGELPSMRSKSECEHQRCFLRVLAVQTHLALSSSKRAGEII